MRGRVGGADQGQSERDDERGARTLACPTGDEHGGVRGERARRRRRREHPQTRRVHAAAAEPVAQRRGREQQHRHDEVVGVDRPFELVGPRAEVALDGGERGGDDERVKGGHERGDGGEGEHPPPAPDRGSVHARPTHGRRRIRQPSAQPSPQSGDAAAEEPALRGARRPFHGHRVGRAGFRGPIQPAQQVAAGRVQQVVPLQLAGQLVDERQGRPRGRRPTPPRPPGGAARPATAAPAAARRRARTISRQSVSGPRGRVHGGDRRLQLVRPRPARAATRRPAAPSLRRSCRGPTARGPGRRAAPARRRRRAGPRGGRPAAASAPAARPPPARRASARRATRASRMASRRQVGRAPARPAEAA